MTDKQKAFLDDLAERWSVRFELSPFTSALLVMMGLLGFLFHPHDPSFGWQCGALYIGSVSLTAFLFALVETCRADSGKAEG